MKRSEINKALKDLENMLREYRYFLPKFADFTPEEWKQRGMSLMRSVTTCWDGISQIMVSESLMK